MAIKDALLQPNGVVTTSTSRG